MNRPPQKSSDPKKIEDGHYAKKQIHCKSRLIAWSHQSRFDYGIKLAERCYNQVILDYGCGDGTFLNMLKHSDHPPLKSVGAEITDKLIQDCISRLGSDDEMEFRSIESLKTKEHDHRFDAIFCMEVLEHVVEPLPILEDFRRWLKPDGRLIISVPVETGPALLVKQVARRIAGWRGLGDYPGFDPYTFKELFLGLVAGTKQHIRRPIHRNEAAGYESHDHKGFNWKYLRSLIEKNFIVESVHGTPLSWAPIGCCSQVWMITKPNPS